MRSLVPVALIALCAALASPAAAADRTALPVDAWLVSGPVAVALPAFHDEKPGTVVLKDLLDFAELDPGRLRPHDGEGGWRARRAGDDVLELKAEAPAEAWLFTYVDVPRWTAPTLEVTCAHPLKAWLDGAPVDLKEKDGVLTADLKLEPGKRRLVLRTLRDPDVSEPWTVKAALVSGADAPALRPVLDPERAVDIRDVLDAPKVTSVAVSPDGKLAVVALRGNEPDGTKDAWLEVRRLKSGAVVTTWRGALEASQVAWLPDGDAFSYASEADGKTTVWVYDTKTGETRPAVRDVEHFQRYAWNPDGRALVYAYGVEAKPDDRNVKRLRAIQDRWPWFRNRSYLVEVAWPGGAARRLTAGDVAVSHWSFSSDGGSLLFSRAFPDPSQRPYERTVWSELSLADLKVTQVLDDPWVQSLVYGPDDDHLLATGTPSAFGGIGRDLPPGVQVNDDGGELFLYDRAKATAEPLTRDYDPDVLDAVWRRDGHIVARVADGQDVRLAVGKPGKPWSELDAGVEVVGDWNAAADAPVAACTGTSVATPQVLNVVDLGGGRPRTLVDPGAARYRDVEFGRVEPFVATLPDGEKLDGRVYYPLGYEPGKKYPAIVYYYGGTIPITNDFGGRYPKNVWAGRGYFIYVPEPSGAWGYGQEFAARHVNDWGKRTAGEVIDGTKAFLAAYPDADPGSVGCIGASYGGFLTEYVITRTDMFRCAVSHAGISSIAGYWGGGYWGFSYGAEALADSFPWNARDLYVDQSALFHADRIHTPLLLLHGDQDTNVPTHESDGLYTALKLLGREVEYVQVAGQDHHILERDRRIVWNDTILAWFARELKGDDAWWKALYPD